MAFCALLDDDEIPYQNLDSDYSSEEESNYTEKEFVINILKALNKFPLPDNLCKYCFCYYYIYLYKLVKKRVLLLDLYFFGSAVVAYKRIIERYERLYKSNRCMLVECFHTFFLAELEKLVKPEYTLNTTFLRDADILFGIQLSSLDLCLGYFPSDSTLHNEFKFLCPPNEFWSSLQKTILTV